MTGQLERPPLVLVADPDPATRELVRGVLAALDAGCEAVIDVEACLRRMRAGDVDLVLLATVLGEDDPVALCQRLRAECPAVPVVLSVGADEDTSLRGAEEAGVLDILPRRAHPAVLSRMLERSLSGRAAHSGAGLSELAALVKFIQKEMPIAQGEAKHIAVLSIELHGAGAEQFAADGETRVFLEKNLFEAADMLYPDDRPTAPRPRVRLVATESGFVAAITELERVQDAAKVASRLQERLSSRPGDEVPNGSIGIAAFPQDGSDAARLVELARHASTRAKLEGRNSLEYYTESMSRWALERLTLENSLRNALENDELVVYYQPRVDITSRGILGMEALVRWIHPQLGLVSPAQFIPLAEETGLIGPIGEWVLREACRQNQEWRDKGYPPIKVSVNLSPLQFRQPDLFERVCAALESTGLPAHGLELEVTESMLMHDPKATIAVLEKVKGAGIAISIDDFGTGYSSLSYLKQFPIDSLKIDRSFVRDLTINADDAAIATAIILMGHSLKLNVVAEGVETESQLAFLQVLQCNEIQGYLISPPVPGPKAERLLAADLSAAA